MAVVSAPERDQRRYLWLMGLCLALIGSAWTLVRLWSTPAAVAMSVVAAALPPIAVVVANRGALRRLEHPARPLPREEDR